MLGRPRTSLDWRRAGLCKVWKGILGRWRAEGWSSGKAGPEGRGAATRW